VNLRAPFPWFGGKSRAAGLIWPRFGDAPNYVEPFAGSLAVLLARPDDWPPRVETVNDVDAYLANFWRAVAADPDEVARHADWPVNESDLHARHRWLVETAHERVQRVTSDPEYFDAKIAGWWVWGQCLWIGSGWCARPEWTGRGAAGRNARGVHTDQYKQRPDLTNDGRGVLALPHKRPMATGNGQGCGVHRVWEKRPSLRKGGRGVAGPSVEYEYGDAVPPGKEAFAGGDPVTSRRRPNLGGAGGGQGVQAPRLTKEQIPDLSGSRGATGRGIHATAFDVRSGGLYAYMQTLSIRLRRVRVCCGDWTRVLTPAVTSYIGATAILLDPPYSHAERSICYSHDQDISGAVAEWAIAHGDDPKLRIALCGYEGEHEMPSAWDCVSWKAGGGYGRSVRGKANRHRERIWFSPHCLADNSLPLLTEAATA
jgi:hypothetical protein